jgi:cell division protein FtsW (lipid II flippase)
VGFGIEILSVASGRMSSNADLLLKFREKQHSFLLVALILLGIAAVLPLDLRRHGKIIRRASWAMFTGSCTLLLGILCIPGMALRRNGSTRWLHLDGIPFCDQVQVSEVTKIAFLFVLSLVLHDSRRHFQPGHAAPGPMAPPGAGHRFWPLRIVRPGWSWNFPWVCEVEPASPGWRNFISGFFVPCLIIGIPVLFILGETDLGMAILYVLVAGALLFVNGVRLRYLIPTALTGILAVFAYVHLDSTRAARIIGFIDPEGLRGGLAMQLYNGLLALGSGGVGGVGLDKVIMPTKLAESHTDFVFSVIGEGKGLLGTGAVVLFYLLFFTGVAARLRHAHDVFQFNICFGAALFITLQALVNMCVVTGLIPTTGMTLPFVSYGITSLLSSAILTGLVINCLWRWRKTPGIGGNAFEGGPQ